jgi:hypothetical protein
MTVRSGAVIVRRPEGRAFVRAGAARQIVPEPPISRVPGSGLAMALVSGHVLGVLELGEPSGALIVCQPEREAFALSGLVIERVGFYPVDERGALVDGERIPELHVDRLLRQSASLSGPWRAP